MVETTRVWVQWLTTNKNLIDIIRMRFSIPDYRTLNGWSPVEVQPGDMELLKSAEANGTIRIINLGWRRSGSVYEMED